MKKIEIKHYILGKKRRLTLVCARERVYNVWQVSIGHSISNPKDTFDKKIGELIASNRLQHSERSNRLFESYITAKYINTDYILSTMDLLAETIKNNLEAFIKGNK